MRNYPQVTLTTPYGEIAVTILDPDVDDNTPLTHNNTLYDDSAPNKRRRAPGHAAMVQVEKAAPIRINGVDVYGSTYLTWQTVPVRIDSDETRVELRPDHRSDYWRRASNGEHLTANAISKLWGVWAQVAEYLRMNPQLVLQARRVTLVNRTQQTAAKIGELRLQIVSLSEQLERELAALAAWDKAVGGQ